MQNLKTHDRTRHDQVKGTQCGRDEKHTWQKETQQTVRS